MSAALLKVRPRIGLSADALPPGDYSPGSSAVLCDRYSLAIVESGGIPLIFPHYEAGIAAYLDMVDGVLIPGNRCDVHPHRYGEEPRSCTLLGAETRACFEVALIHACIASQKPLFGICGGLQLLNVVLGGSLIQDIEQDCSGALSHAQNTRRSECVHEILIEPQTWLSQAVGGLSRYAVNSIHHQAIARLAPDLLISARAPDGMIEAVEHRHIRGILGVQWHPEYLLTASDRALLQRWVLDICGEE